ncbi:MAG: PAS domain S-box protein [Chitinivibrionales bacterium]|nr:PAS domain S-box protein [Chitinivibrionales bacterium]MBD3396371.1 PAS domain S-box protein [Chitinivibrionales bacterium]
MPARNPESSSSNSVYTGESNKMNDRTTEEFRAEMQRLRHRNAELEKEDGERKKAEAQREAAYQQLQAGEQQLRATEQQLRAANQQLQASEQEARTSEAQYRTLVENIPQKIFMKDRNCKWVSVNRTFASDLGIDPEDAKGKKDWDFFPKELADKYHADDLRIMKTGETDDLVEKYTQGGKERWVHTIKAPVRDATGKIRGVLGVFWDVTEEKEAQETLRKSEAQMRGLFESSMTGMLFWNAEGDITDANETFLRMVGYSKEDVLSGKVRWRDMTPPEYREQDERMLAEIMETGKGTPIEKEYICGNGSRVPVLLGVASIPGPSMSGVAFVLDITLRKRAEQQQERLNQMLKQKNAELEQIVYATSHDLRSPLVNVQGFSKELGRCMADLNTFLADTEVPHSLKEKLKPVIDEDIPDAVAFIQTSVAKMDSLLTGLLKLSRLGRAAIQIGAVDAGKMVKDVFCSFEYAAKEQGIRLAVAGDLPPCKADAGQLNQVFSNLIDNALKYLDPARPGEITVSGERNNGEVVYRIADNGVGMKPEHCEKAFEIFHRLDPERAAGEGLGLTIVRRSLERQNGRIWVESVPGKGSTFSVALPAA